MQKAHVEVEWAYMKIGVFTSNQPRHLALLAKLATVAQEVIAITECTAAYHPDHYTDASLRDYFARVAHAEAHVFGSEVVLAENIHTLALSMGQASQLPLSAITPLLTADLCIVFGSSYLTGPVGDALIQQRAINIHMGLAPYYRGAACNFWALYDDRPAYVGATLHYLAAGIDNGDILYHVLPRPQAVDPFIYGMLAVAAAQHSLVQHLQQTTLPLRYAQPQHQVIPQRYTRRADFTPTVAATYLQQSHSPLQLAQALATRDVAGLIRPVVV